MTKILTRQDIINKTKKQLDLLMDTYKIPHPKNKLQGINDYRQYLFTNYIKHKIPLCSFCKSTYTTLKLNTLMYQTFCSVVCSAKYKLLIHKKKIKKQYGVSNVSQLQFVKDKKVETNRKNRGVDYPQQCKKVRKLSVKTNLEKYGKENVSQVDLIKEKRNKTFIERFGGNPFQNKKIKEKIKNKHMKIRGVEHPAHCPKVMKKIKRTNMKRFGVPWAALSEQSKKQYRKTCFKRFGVPSPMQNLQIFEKQQIRGFKVRYANFDKKQQIPMRGYEPQVADFIYQKYKFKIKSIKQCNIPPIWYKDPKTRITRRYYPDFCIVNSQGQLCVVEVKSSHTIGIYDKNVFNKNIAKFKSAIKTLKKENIDFHLALYFPKPAKIVWIKSPQTRSRLKLKAALLNHNLISRK
jgi:hypothetical protein